MAVDDDPMNLQVIAEYLEGENYHLVSCHHGKQALESIEEHGAPDLLLLDVMMPHVSGLEVCRKLREQFDAQQLPIVFLTAKTQSADLEAGLEAGANDYVTKPFSKQELLARLKSQLQLAQYAKHVAQSLVKEALDPKTKKIISSIEGCLDSILYIQAHNQYVEVVCTNEPQSKEWRIPLKKLLLYFDEQLVQIHRSYLIPPKNLSKLRYQHTIGYDILLGEKALPIGRSYLAKLKEAYPQWFKH